MMNDFWFRFLLLSIPALSLFALGYMIGSERQHFHSKRHIKSLEEKGCLGENWWKCAPWDLCSAHKVSKNEGDEG